MRAPKTRGLLVGLHGALAIVLVATTVSLLSLIADRFQSSYWPPYYPLVVLLVLGPVVVATTLVALLALWLRREVRWPLFLADLAAWWLGWSFFVTYFFAGWIGVVLASLSFALAPVCFAVAAGVAFLERRGIASA